MVAAGPVLPSQSLPAGDAPVANGGLSTRHGAQLAVLSSSQTTARAAVAGLGVAGDQPGQLAHDSCSHGVQGSGLCAGCDTPLGSGRPGEPGEPGLQALEKGHCRCAGVTPGVFAICGAQPGELGLLAPEEQNCCCADVASGLPGEPGEAGLLDFRMLFRSCAGMAAVKSLPHVLLLGLQVPL